MYEKNNITLKFKNQDFQTDASRSICDVFDGLEQISTDNNEFNIDNNLLDDNQANLDFEIIGTKNVAIPPYMQDNILKNIRNIQNENGNIYPISDKIEPMLLVKANKQDGTPAKYIPYNFTIEMETGTGKSYTYIKTMYELNKKYGWNKFIIIVPSVAIREGVKQTFRSTQKHFYSEYRKHIFSFIYDSQKALQDINQFAQSKEICAMIINSQAFAAQADKRIISSYRDSFGTKRPIDVIAGTNPILIIDEPQSVLGPKTKERLADFNPLMTIGYSATHKETYNVMYRLDAMDAYNKKIVKKIEVKGISASGVDGTEPYMYFSRIFLSKDKYPQAILEFCCAENSKLKIKQCKVEKGFDLYAHSNNIPAYKGYIISEEINASTNTITFQNGKTIQVGEVKGNDNNSEQIRRIQIRETIKTHLKREEELYYQGIKVLSLFFIDEVKKYRDYSDPEDTRGLYAKLFEEEYDEVVNSYVCELGNSEYAKHLQSIKTKETHNGYFSQDKNNHFIDGKTKNGISEDQSAYELIMKNKERLLSFDEPTRFIFSHSALKEGWDNPNVFQICFLKDGKSITSKKQEVGRGLRLAVNKYGDRMDEDYLGNRVQDINVLTVIASDSYKNFVDGLQTEYAESIANRPQRVEQEFLVGKILKDDNGNKLKISDMLANKIINFWLIKEDYIDENYKLTDKYKEDERNHNIQLNDRVKELEPYKDSLINLLNAINSGAQLKITDPRDYNVSVRLKQDRFDKKEFQDLWNKINIKTIYEIDFDTNDLIEKAVNALDRELEISKIDIQIQSGTLDTIKSKAQIQQGEAFKITNIERIKLDNSGTKQKYDLIGRLVTETGLLRKTIATILTNIKPFKFELFKRKPEEFILKVAKIINEQKATLIVEHITYEPLTERYSSNIFTEPSWRGKLGVDTFETKKNVFDYLVWSSKVEKDFASDLEVADEVVIYTKLPGGFHIPTPVGSYNPDWAIVFKQENVKHIYFVAETKGSMDSLQIKPIEKAKAHCAEEHFKAISCSEVKYKLIDTYKSLLTEVMK